MHIASEQHLPMRGYFFSFFCHSLHLPQSDSRLLECWRKCPLARLGMGDVIVHAINV